MKRKPGALVPFERSIVETAIQLRRDGIDHFHGFQIAKEIEDRDDRYKLTAYGTLYRALLRLEKMGYLRSEWEDPDIAIAQGRPRRRIYQLTGAEASLPLRSTSEVSSTNLIWRASTA